MSVDGEGRLDAAPLERQLFPCTSPQARWWILNKLRPEDSSSNIAVLWQLTGAVSTEAIAHAFGAVIARHEILRTRFVEVDGEPMQEVQTDARFSVSEIDLSILEPSLRAEHLRAVCAREAKRRFDLSAAPLLRATLIRSGENRAHLLIVVHHSAFDGWSIRVLGREFGESLRALLEGGVPLLPELALQYGDYALWRAETKNIGAAREHADYWTRKLANLDYWEVTPDRPREISGVREGAVVACDLDGELADCLEGAAKSLGVSFFSFGCALIAAMLRAWNKSSEIVLGTQVAGRADGDLADLIGVFVNNLVLRLQTDQIQTFDAFVAHVAGTVTEAIAHEDLPFEDLVGLLNHKRDMSRTPLYSVNVTIQNAFLEDRDYGAIAVRSAPSPSAGALHDLAFQMVKRPSGWRVTLEYDARLFHRQTAQRLFDQWLSAMRIAAANPGALMSDFKNVFGPVSEIETELVPAEARTGDTRDQLSDVEQKLAEIWRDTLHAPKVERDSNFFELGGHSLPAMRMLARAQAALGVKLDPGVFFRGPTIGELARHACAPQTLEPWRIVTFHSSGAGQALIALNGTMLYYGLAQNLAEDHPFISVQAFDPHTREATNARTLPDIAADYVRLIRAARPHGPYVLVGHCAIGSFAFEAAQQLIAAGENVSAIVMFDAWAPNHSRAMPWLRRLAMNTQYWLHDHRRRLARVMHGETTWLQYFASLRVVGAMFDWLKAHRLIEIAPLGDAAMAWFMKDLLAARVDYHPLPFAGDVIVFKSDDCPTGPAFDRHFGWRALVGGRLEVHHVGGSHLSMCAGGRGKIVADHVQAFLRPISQLNVGRAPSSP